MDLLSGYETHLGSFYYLMVGVVAWNSSRAVTLVFAATSVVVWTVADHYAGHKYPTEWVLYWNITNRAIVTFATALTIFTIKATLEKQQRLIVQLRNTLLNLSEMKSHLSVCNICHGFRDDAEHRAELTAYVEHHPEPISLGGVCTHCLAERAERIRQIPVDEVKMRELPAEPAMAAAEAA